MKDEEELRFLFLKQSKDHNARFNEIQYSWIAHTMTILAAMLALLAGLSADSSSVSCLALYLLRALYVLSAATLIVGAVAIRGRARTHQIARDKLEDELSREKLDIAGTIRDKSHAPFIYNVCYLVYPWLFYASILALAAYGIARTV
jgi:hypothetical protein